MLLQLNLTHGVLDSNVLNQNIYAVVNLKIDKNIKCDTTAKNDKNKKLSICCSVTRHYMALILLTVSLRRCNHLLWLRLLSSKNVAPVLASALNSFYYRGMLVLQSE